MGSTIGTLPLTQVVLPSTHDSGAYGFTASSIIAPDFPPVASRLQSLAQDAEDEKANCPDGIKATCEGILEGFAADVRDLAAGFEPGRPVDTVSPDIGQFVADVSNAQGRDIGQQLHDGIRRFDLRLCAPVAPRTELTLCHGLYGDGITTALSQIKQFVQAHPAEVVIIGLNRFVGANGPNQHDPLRDGQHKALITQLRQLFATDTGGQCDRPDACLLVPSSLGPSATLNAIWATPGRVIVVDEDKGLVAWDAQQHPTNPVLWSSSTTAGEWIQTDDPGAFQGYVFADLDCRCLMFEQAQQAHPDNLRPRTDKLYDLGTNLSPTEAWVPSALVQRLLRRYVPVLGPVLAKAILGDGYFKIGPDVANGPVLGERAAISNPLILNGIYHRVMANPQLRYNVNSLTTDWYHESSLVDIAIALNGMFPHFEVAASTAPSGSTYPVGAWTGEDVRVAFTCVQPNGTRAGAGTIAITQDTNGGLTVASTDSRVSACVSAYTLPAPTVAFGPIRVDKRPPVVTYTGNAGRYTVDQQVAITCAAADPEPGAGLAATTCAAITGPAYAFHRGTAPTSTATFSATGTDHVGNVGTGQTSFTVEVTPASLNNLIARFTTDAGVAGALQQHVGSIASAPTATAKAGKVEAFTYLVNAQTGKSLSAEHAAILIRLARAL